MNNSQCQLWNLIEPLGTLDEIKNNYSKTDSVFWWIAQFRCYTYIYICWWTFIIIILLYFFFFFFFAVLGPQVFTLKNRQKPLIGFWSENMIDWKTAACFCAHLTQRGVTGISFFLNSRIFFLNLLQVISLFYQKYV